MATKDQLHLFGAPPVTTQPRVRAAQAPDTLHRLAERLPDALRLGATSWTTPQWDGLVWERQHPKPVLAHEGMGSYAKHPLLRTVLVDRSAGMRLDTAALGHLAAAVPDDFRFVLAADESIFLGRLPDHPRFGEHAGLDNPAFFDVATMRTRSVDPYLEGLGDRGGALLIPIPNQDPRSLGTRKAFPERLHRFLRGLPTGPQYAVELRDHKLLTSEYAAALADAGAIHCISVHPSMPDIATQRQVVRVTPAPMAMIRWSMCVHFDYRQAARNYAPYDTLVDRDHRARATLVALLRELASHGTPTYALVDNMAEGCAPQSIADLARALIG